MGLTDYSVREANNLSLGMMDFDVVSNTTKSPPAGEIYHALVVDSDATFSAVTEGGDDLPTLLRTAGHIRLGRFKSVTVTDTGTVLAYRAPKV